MIRFTNKANTGKIRFHYERRNGKPKRTTCEITTYERRNDKPATWETTTADNFNTTTCEIITADNFNTVKVYTGVSNCIDDFVIVDHPSLIGPALTIPRNSLTSETYNVIKTYTDKISGFKVAIVRGDNFNYATGRLIAIKKAIANITDKELKTNIMNAYIKYEQRIKLRKEARRLRKRLKKINSYFANTDNSKLGDLRGEYDLF